MDRYLLAEKLIELGIAKIHECLWLNRKMFGDRFATQEEMATLLDNQDCAVEVLSCGGRSETTEFVIKAFAEKGMTTTEQADALLRVLTVTFAGKEFEDYEPLLLATKLQEIDHFKTSTDCEFHVVMNFFHERVSSK